MIKRLQAACWALVLIGLFGHTAYEAGAQVQGWVLSADTLTLSTSSNVVIKGTLVAGQMGAGGTPGYSYTEPGSIVVASAISPVPPYPTLWCNLTNPNTSSKHCIEGNLISRSSGSPSNTNLIALQGYMQPDNGGDVSVYYGLQTGGGNAASFFHLSSQRPAGFPALDNGFAVEAQADLDTTTGWFNQIGSGLALNLTSNSGSPLNASGAAPATLTSNNALITPFIKDTDSTDSILSAETLTPNLITGGKINVLWGVDLATNVDSMLFQFNYVGNNSASNYALGGMLGVADWVWDTAGHIGPQQLATATGNKLCYNSTTFGTLSYALLAGCTPTATYLPGSFPSPVGTTSTTCKMMGLGSAATITPAVTGRIHVDATFQAQDDTLNDGVVYGLKIGTGTAPANGDALTGSDMGPACASTNYTWGGTGVAAGIGATVHLSGNFAGVAGTPYWVDVPIAALTGGTATITKVQITMFEF